MAPLELQAYCMTRSDYSLILQLTSPTGSYACTAVAISASVDAAYWQLQLHYSRYRRLPERLQCATVALIYRYIGSIFGGPTTTLHPLCGQR